MNESIQVLASRWKRLGGALLDGLILMGILYPFAFLIGAFEQTGRGGKISMEDSIVLFLFGLIAFLAVNGYLLQKHGQTVGKKIVGIRIVDYESGEIISVWKVFGLRLLPIHLISEIPILGVGVGLADSLLIFLKEKRCIHDLIAGTKVVDVKTNSNQSIEAIA